MEEENFKSPRKNESKFKKIFNKFKYIINILLVLIVTVVALLLSMWNDFDNVLKNLMQCNWWYILIVCGIMGLCILVRGLILFCFARLYTKKYRYHQALACDQVGVFYNAVTPGASGGQVMQSYTFKKQGVPISSAVSIMAMYSILFQTVLIIYGLVSFFVKYDVISSVNAEIPLFGLVIKLPMWALTIIGFLLNVSVILLVLLMAYWRGFHNFIMGPCINFLSKIKIIKNKEKSQESLRVQVENFKMEFRRLWSNIPFALLIALLFTIYMTFKFSLPYFVGLAIDPNCVGVSNESPIKLFFDAVFLSNYHQMVTGLIPIPGSAGVSEYFFIQLFKGNFYSTTQLGGNDITSTALLLWRSITFSIPLLFAGITTAFYKGSPKEVIGRNGVPSRQTYVDLQHETLAIRKEEIETFIETRTLSKKAILDSLKNATKNKSSTTKNKKTNHNSSNKNKINKNEIKKENKKEQDTVPNRKMDNLSIEQDDDLL